MKTIILLLLKFYKYNISQYMKIYFGGGCRYTPTCSEYACGVIRKHGVLRGSLLSLKRFVRCNPMSPQGFDPV